MNKTATSLSTIISIALLTSGCSWFKKEDDTVYQQPKPLTDYHTSRPLSPLEVPPDLISDTRSEQMTVPAYDKGDITYSDYSGKQVKKDSIETAVSTDSSQETTISVATAGMYIERAGSQRWLVVPQSMSQVWPHLNTFVLANGLTIKREDKALGIIETDWAENHASGVLRGSQKYLGKWLGSLYTTGTRDKFRLRIEPGRKPGSSEVYLTHRGMKEVVTQDNNVDPKATVWEPSGSDPEVEAEMLTLLMISLGSTRQDASEALKSPQPDKERATIVTAAGAAPVLMLDDGLDIAWRRVGQTLDRVGFMVEDRNRAEGIYFVRYGDPEVYEKKKGFFGRLFKGKDDELSTEEYRIKLTDKDGRTEVSVANTDGDPAPKKVTTQILTLLQEQLK
jgi:outer membrane protein assembly factor BamC